MLRRLAFAEYLLNNSSDSSPAPGNLLSCAFSIALVALSSPVKLINSSLLNEDRRIKPHLPFLQHAGLGICCSEIH